MALTVRALMFDEVTEYGSASPSVRNYILRYTVYSRTQPPTVTEAHIQIEKVFCLTDEGAVTVTPPFNMHQHAYLDQHNMASHTSVPSELEASQGRLEHCIMTVNFAHE